MYVPALIAALALAAGEPAGHDHSAHAAHGHEGGLAWTVGTWSIAAHGFANAIVDHQGGRRGDDKNFSNSMFMATAERSVGAGKLELRSMLSLDPAMGAGGYPLLFQTGETEDGVTHLIDRQHPHDFFMEMAARYRQPFGADQAWFVYAGLPGEPALGPPAFMHRASGIRIPEAPLTHHWLDSTHITMGVVTFGVELGAWTLEASAFNGREPDQHRWNIETARLDSSSARVSWSPAAGWSLQASYGDIRDPEVTEHGVHIRRTTASAIYEGQLLGRPWATTLAWGRNDKSRERTQTRYRLPGWLLETTLEPFDGHAAFLRAERITHDDAAIPLTFRKLSVGYIYEIVQAGPVRIGIGALGSWLDPAEVTRFFYGDHPTAYMVFLQARL
jgi:hypothetical protein